MCAIDEAIWREEIEVLDLQKVKEELLLWDGKKWVYIVPNKKLQVQNWLLLNDIKHTKFIFFNSISTLESCSRTTYLSMYLCMYLCLYVCIYLFVSQLHILPFYSTHPQGFVNHQCRGRTKTHNFYKLIKIFKVLSSAFGIVGWHNHQWVPGKMGLADKLLPGCKRHKDTIWCRRIKNSGTADQMWMQSSWGFLPSEMT